MVTITDESKYLNAYHAYLEGLITGNPDKLFQNLPLSRKLYVVDVPYSFQGQLHRFDGLKIRQVCIHLKNKEECEVNECPFSSAVCVQKRKEGLIKRFPNLDFSKYCEDHMYKKNTCKFCFKNGLKVSKRCKCGNIWDKCVTCENDGTNAERRAKSVNNSLAEYWKEKRIEMRSEED